MNREAKKWSVVLCLSLLVSACAQKVATSPSPLSTMTPASWSEWVADDASSFISWEVFKDPQLKRLIAQGLDGSLSIESARQRIESANLHLVASEASRLPTVSLSGSASQSGELDGGQSASFSSSLTASYEVDVWGRRKQRISRVSLNVSDAEISMQSARISLAATIADIYFNIQALDKKLALQQKFLGSAHSQRRFIEARLSAGLVIRNDLDRQDVQIADIETNIEERRSSRTQLLNALAVVLGQSPGTFKLDVREVPLYTPPRLAAGAPAGILRHRPDIKLSELDLAHSLIDVELVRTDLFPSFSLSSSANVTTGSLDKLFSAITLPWAAITRATLPLLDGKARETQLKISALGHAQVVTAYKQTILRAIQDVESALSSQESIARQKQSFARKLASQQRVSFDTKEKYKRGKASAFDLLNDSTILISYEQQEVDIWRASINSTIGLLRAFGIDPEA